MLSLLNLRKMTLIAQCSHSLMPNRNRSQKFLGISPFSRLGTGACLFLLQKSCFFEFIKVYRIAC